MARQSRGPPPTTDNKVKQAIVGIAFKHWDSVYATAKGVGMSAKTLTRRLNGGKSRVEAREEQQKLIKTEEKVLVKWITHLTATGHPARHAFIRDMAEEIRQQRGPEMGIELPLGSTWVQQFIGRHSQLKTVISRSIEAARIKDVTIEVVMKFFEALEACKEEYQITLENMYNMDETGNTSSCY
jgi:hypothetical protein